MDYEAFQPILQWIGDHPTWSGIAVFLISLSESLAIVGLIVPGVVMMTAIGAMMGAGILPFWETLIWAILGAIVGDGISYWLGYHYHQHLRDFWPFKQFPQLLARGEIFFKNHGGKSIIFGRFVGPVRPMIPVIAGMMDMTPKRFLFFNIVSAIAWAPLYSLPGIMIGASLGKLSPDVAKKIVLLILLLLLAIWIIYTFLLKIGIWFEQIITRILNRAWQRWQRSNKLPWLHKALATAQGSEEGQLGTALFFIFTTAIFLLSIYNIQHHNGMYELNEPVYQLFRALYVDRLIDFVALFATLGAPLTILPTAFGIALWFLWRKRYFVFFCWMTTIFGGAGLGYLFRPLIAMERPLGLVGTIQEYSFPSGHVLVTTLLFGFSSVLIQYAVSKNHRWIIWAISIPFIFLMALSRLYLGVHWFTDVIGGLSLGTAFVCLGTLIYRRFEHRSIPIRAILLPGLLIFSIAVGLYIWQIYPKKRAELKRQWTISEFKTKDWLESNQPSIYRTGILRRVPKQFDLEWLGSIDQVKSFLTKNGWQAIPQLTFQSTLSVLAKEPSPKTVPVLPRFHRDRLPMLVLTKSYKQNSRLILQLWRSDYVNEQKKPLWLGTIRLEELKHPFPLISLYQETNNNHEVLEKLTQELKHSSFFKFKIIEPMHNDKQKVLLIY